MQKSNQPSQLTTEKSVVLNQSKLYFISDQEGSRQFQAQFDGLIPQNTQLDQPVKYICGGDVSGSKGPGSLRMLLDIKNNFGPDKRWIKLIAGNRDDNRLRFLTELANQQFIENFFSSYITANQAGMERRWLDKDQALIEPEPGNWSEMPLVAKRAYVAKWMLAKTMGSAPEFEQRRTELSEILSINSENQKQMAIPDEWVAQSFIEEMCDPYDEKMIQAIFGSSFAELTHRVLPREYWGVGLWYIQNSDLLHFSDGVLYSHSAYQSKTNNPDTLNQTVAQWVDFNNHHRAQSINNLLQQVRSGVNDPTGQYYRKDPAIMGSLPATETNCDNNLQSQNILLNYYLNDRYEAITLPEGVKLNVCGHQPILQNIAMVMAVRNGYIINADTSFIPCQQDTHQASLVTLNFAQGSGHERNIVGFDLMSNDGKTVHVELNQSCYIGHRVIIENKAYHVSAQNAEKQYILNRYECKNFFSITETITVTPAELKNHLAKQEAISLSNCGQVTVFSHIPREKQGLEENNEGKQGNSDEGIGPSSYR